MVLDVTVGLGGHAKKFLEHIGPRGTLIGMDADSENLKEAAAALHNAGNVRLMHANFRELPSLALPSCDILFADLGLSSPHLDAPERGFSFRYDAPLDGRYDRTTGNTTADLLAESSKQELLQLFERYGEIPQAKRLTAAILERRQEKPLQRTRELTDVVHAVYGHRASSLLPQVFQALRIAVNEELKTLHILLSFGPTLLTPSGRMGIISYHSLEDRMVKQRFKELTTGELHPVTGKTVRPALFEPLTKGAIQAENLEVERNPRARSARLRAIGKRIPPV